MNENERFFRALIAPVGITIMGLWMGIEPIFLAGLVFIGLVILARVLRSRG